MSSAPYHVHESSMEAIGSTSWNRRTVELGKGGDWLEILGSGMVHPRVLANCGIDPREWQGLRLGHGSRAHRHAQTWHDRLRPFFDSDIRWAAPLRLQPTGPHYAARGGLGMKFTPLLAEGASRDRCDARRVTDTLTRIGLELEDVEDRGSDLAAFRIAAVVEADSIRKPIAARVHRRYRQRHRVVVCGAPMPAPA